MFKKSLEQEIIFEEIKNGTGHLLINAKAGTGKCLGKDTLVVLHNGKRVKVQNIKEGDLLMGDDGKPRTVLSISKGEGKLYKVLIPITGEYFICNKDHILTCTDKMGSNLNPIDISVHDLLEKYTISSKPNHKTFIGVRLYRYLFDIHRKQSKINYYEIGCDFFVKKQKYVTLLTTLTNRLEIISGIIDTYTFPIKSNLKIKKHIKSNPNFDLFNTLLRSCGFEFDKSINVIDGDYSKINLRNKEFYEYLDLDQNKKGVPYIMDFLIEEYKELGDYYGFTLDGNGRFLVNDFIVTHNTTTIVKSLDLIDESKSIMLLAFNKHIANELKERAPKKEKLRVSTTHATGWGAILRKYKGAEVDDDKAFKIIRRKISRWNLNEVDNIDEYVSLIKKMVDLCRVTLTTRREAIPSLAQRHGLKLTDEDARRVLTVIEDMLNDTKTFDYIDMIFVPAIDNKIWLFPSDYVFVDECIDGRCNIKLKNGNYISLEDLYKKHTDSKGKLIDSDVLPEVLSYDVNNERYEYKKITNIQYKGSRDVYKLVIRKSVIVATDSHLFYTPDGWRELKDLKTGDILVSDHYNMYSNAYYPNDEQTDFMFSYLICYYLNGYNINIHNFRLYIKKRDKKKFDFINRITPLFLKSTNDYIKTNEYTTAKFYIDEKIFNKEYIINNITDKHLGLVYIMSNKYFSDINKYGFYISVNTYDEVVYAKELFERKFEKIFDIKRHKKGSYLVPRDQDWFFEKIIKYIPKKFSNIVPEKFIENMGGYIYYTNTKQKYCGIVNKVIKYKTKHDTYDITVKGNHNFFVYSNNINTIEEKHKKTFAGYLTHNCQDYNKAQQFMLNKIVKKDTGRLISIGDERQSIYAFSGSNNDAFNWFREKENTRELTLSTSYRCSRRVIELAQTIVPTIRCKDGAEEGEVRNGSVLEEAKPGDFILARKNKPLVVLLFDLLRDNKLATIRGNDIGKRLAETVNKYKTISDLNHGLNDKLNEMRDYLMQNLGVIDYRSDPRYVSLEDNIEIIRFLMANTNTIERIIEKLMLIFTDKPEGIILSTIHKSKGLEADNVFIIRPDEIRLKTPSPESAMQEANLEYIAYTRAKKNLIMDIDWTDERN